MHSAGSTKSDEAIEAIDPQVALFVRAVRRGYAGYPDFNSRNLPEQRAISEEVRRPWRVGGPPMERCEDLLASGPLGRVRIRLFDHTAAAAARPALIYLHGGGFSSFSLDTHDRLMREYAARSGAIVIGVDYSLSPEAKFPVALTETVCVADWLAEKGPDVGVDPNAVAIGGDSAGANLALAACVVLRRRGDGARMKAMLLNYGFFDSDFTTGSHARHGGADKLLTTDELAQYIHNYVGGTPHAANPLALPIHADLHGMPPSFHTIAQCDPLADGDRAMVAKLEAAGNAVTSIVYPGATHSFLEAVSVASLADQALSDASSWLAAALAAERTSFQADGR